MDDLIRRQNEMEEIKPLELIDKNKAVETLRSRAERITNANIVRWTLMVAANFIDNMSTIEAVPVVSGKRKYVADEDGNGQHICKLIIKGEKL